MSSFIFDIEADGLLDTITKVHCLVMKDIESGKLHSFYGDSIEEGVGLLSSAELLVGHNIIAFDLPALKKVYPDFKYSAKIFDTLIGARLAYSNIYDLDIKSLSTGYLKKDTFQVFNKAKQKYESAIGRHSLEAWGLRLKFQKGDFGHENDWSVFSDSMLAYCQQDVELTYKLYVSILKRDVAQDAIDLEMEVQEIICRQISHGICFDSGKAQELYAVLAAKRNEIKVKLQQVFTGWEEEMKTPEYYAFNVNGVQIMRSSKAELVDAVYRTEGVSLTKKAIGESIVTGPNKIRHTPFNPGSRQHIFKVFNEKYGWKPEVFTETGDAKVDETILESLKYPEAELLLEYLMVEKRIGQIAEGDQNWLSAEKRGRIHGNINTLGANTGRATHSFPNLSQVTSAKKPYGKECRELFTVPKGFKLIDSDAASQELRCLGHYMAKYDAGKYAHAVVTGSKEEGTDAHTLTMKAAGLETRDQAKTVIYACIYGAGDEKMGKIVGKGKKAGSQLKANLFAKMPALERLINEYSKQAETQGFVIALDGRKIYTRSSHSALNALLQGCGAILTKRWMVFVDRELKARGYQDKVHQILYVHDELGFEAPEELAQEVADICVEAMKRVEEYYNFKCPLAAEAAIGDNWYEVH